MRALRRFAILLALLALRPLLAEPAAKVSYGITGVAVSTRDGAPVPYCRMQVTESTAAVVPGADVRRGGGLGGAQGQRGRRAEPTEVDADVRGHFQITVEHAGSYVLTGSARDYRRQNFDAHEGFFSSVVLTPAAPVVNVVFRMERDASITGLVLDEVGDPVRNAQVFAEIPGQADGRGARFGRGGGGQAGFGQTDDRGRYELSGLAPGAYRVRVQAEPWYAQGRTGQFGRPQVSAAATPSPDPSLDVVYPAMWFPGVENEAAAEAIRVSGGEERQVDFHLTPVPSVHLVVPRPEAAPAGDGQVRPQRIAFLVRVSPSGGGGFTQSSVSETTQEFGGLSPGVYEIRTVGSDGRPDPEAKQFRVVPGASGVVDLSTASVLTKVKLVIEGVDAGEAGQLTFVEAASGRTVRADGGFGGFGGRRRGDGGEAERQQAVYLSQGQWEVHVPNFATSYLVSLQATGASSRGATLEVGSEPITLTLHLASGRGEVSGIADADGKPVEGAMVLLVPATLGDPDSVAEVQREQTNTDGSFSLRGVMPGKYILLAIDHGWGVKWRDPATLAGYLAKGVPVEVEAKGKVQRTLVAVEP